MKSNTHDIIVYYGTDTVMFHIHPNSQQLRDYGTVACSETGSANWGQLIDVSLDEPNSLVDAYIPTPMNSKRMLSTNDMRKIVQVTTDDIICSGEISGLNNQSMKFAINIVYKSIRDGVRPAVSVSQMERLIVGTTEQLITHYHQSDRTQKILMELLEEDYMVAFIHRIASQPRKQCDDARMGSENNEHSEMGCFAWFWNLFR